MYSFRHDPLTFRLSANPAGTSTYRRAFDPSLMHFDPYGLCAFLREALSTTMLPNIHRATFTLISVYSDFVQREYGSVQCKPYYPRPEGPIVLTFQLGQRMKPLSRYRLYHKHDRHVVTWGYDGASANDYMSISIPIDLAVRMNGTAMLVDDIQRMYYLVGAFTKGLVLGRTGIRSDNDIYKTLMLYKHLPKALYRNAPYDWAYVKEIWQIAPYMVTLPSTPSFIEYYNKYLGRTAHHKFRDKGSVALYESVEARARELVLDELISPSDSWVSRYVGQNTHGVDVESIVQAICTGETR